MADDYGGPRREFFRLVMIEVQNSQGIFEGKPGDLFFNYSQQLLANNKFYTAGKRTAWSVAHNEPVPAASTAIYI
uniref:HECT domain-containing protein n=1 Tax=Iconisemion striatum TaxID=60296 RepID=A0A1A7WK61_9TELE